MKCQTPNSKSLYCVCLVTIKGHQKNNESEKALVRTMEYVWCQIEDNVWGATCWFSNSLYKDLSPYRLTTLVGPTVTRPVYPLAVKLLDNQLYINKLIFYLISWRCFNGVFKDLESKYFTELKNFKAKLCKKIIWYFQVLVF